MQRAVYASRGPCNYALDCPFISPKHRCVPTHTGANTNVSARGGGSEVGDIQKCWSRTSQPRVSEASCAVRWDSRRFHTAFHNRTVHFIGDSMAAQMWRSLLCFEYEQMDLVNRHRAIEASHELVPHPTCISFTARSGVHVCTVRASDLWSVLAAATRLRSNPSNVLILSAYAHEAKSMAESSQAHNLLEWMRSRPGTHEPHPGTTIEQPLRASIVWRTREADHYGPAGWTGRTLRTCSKATSEEHEPPLPHMARLGGHNSTFAPLVQAGVKLLDGGADTRDAYTAHPAVCIANKSEYTDCRHYCQPGPIDSWNSRLVDLFS